jgi:hypothetical protein
MGEQTHDKPDKPEHPHGTPPGQDPDFVPPGHGGMPPGQEDKPEKPDKPDEEEPHPEHPIAHPPVPEPKE